jgi:hypothetical protein
MGMHTLEDGMGVHSLDSCQYGDLPWLHRSTSTEMQEEPNLIDFHARLMRSAKRGEPLPAFQRLLIRRLA